MATRWTGWTRSRLFRPCIGWACQCYDLLPQRRRSAPGPKRDAPLRADRVAGSGRRRPVRDRARRPAAVAGRLQHGRRDRGQLPGALAARGAGGWAILDSPMTDLSRAVDHGASRQRLPVVGLPLPQSLTDVAKWIAGWRYGVDWRSLDYLRGVAKLQAPILLFQGTADRTVPATTSDELARLARGVTYVRVAGADHLDSWNLEPAHYDRAVQAFVATVLK